MEELEARKRAGEQAEAEADAAAEQRMRRIAEGEKTGPGKARRVDRGGGGPVTAGASQGCPADQD